MRLAREKGCCVAQLKVVPKDLLLRTYEVGGAGGLLGTVTTIAVVTEEFPLGPRAFTACTTMAHDPKSAPWSEMSAVRLEVGGATYSTHVTCPHWRYTLYCWTRAPPPDHANMTLRGTVWYHGESSGNGYRGREWNGDVDRDPDPRISTEERLYRKQVGNPLGQPLHVDAGHIADVGGAQQ